MKSKPKPAKPSGKGPQMAFRGYWDATEEQALRDAVQKHGIGAWEKMRHDVDFKVLKYVPLDPVRPGPDPTARARNRTATTNVSLPTPPTALSFTAFKLNDSRFSCEMRRGRRRGARSFRARIPSPPPPPLIAVPAATIH